MTEKSVSLKQSRITIDDLAIMVNNGFKEVHKELVNRTDGLEVKIDGLREDMNQGFRDVNRRIDTLTTKVDYINLNYSTVSEHSILKNRVKRVEKKVGISIM